MKGQSSIEIMFILASILVLVGAYSAAFYHESRKTMVLSTTKIVASGLASLGVKSPCLYSSVNHAYFNPSDDKEIIIEYSSLTNGGFCIKPGSIESIMGSFLHGYTITEY